MNWRAVRAVVRKDLTVVRRSRALTVPLVMLPLLLLVILPLAFALMPRFVARGAAGAVALQRMLAELPSGLRVGLEGYSPEQAWIVLVNLNLLAPLFLLVPFMVANVIAADSFAGERERKTLEALLYTPTTDAELFVAKTLSSLIPALLVALLGFVLYAVIANVAAWPVMGRVFFPNGTWLVLVTWVAPAFATLGLSSMVLVSLRVSGTQEALQLGGLLVIPLIALIIGQVKGAVLLDPPLLFLVGAAAWLVDTVLLWYGVGSFRRAKLIARL